MTQPTGRDVAPDELGPGQGRWEVPRVAVAAPASGEGKTTIAVGLMAALRERGLDVAPFKTGPDYIDPGYHALATGRPGRNLDAHLTSPELLEPLLLHGFLDEADAPGGGFGDPGGGFEGGRPPSPTLTRIAVIEGAMGLFDGQIGVPSVGRSGFASCAHVVQATRTPLVLVLDASHSTRTLAAVAHGIATFDPAVAVDGVILNRIGSERAQREARRAMDDAGLPVLGCIPRSRDLMTPSRHLGLVPAAERDEAMAMVTAAGHLVAEHVDLEAVLDIAASASPLTGQPWDPAALVTPVTGRPRIAVAAGRAFTFRYPETTELLAAAGCEVVEFDPLTDESLPDGTAGLYLGGGFPEVYATELAGNATLRADIAARVRDGLPTVAECAGLLYLCRSLDDLPMAGALDAVAHMTPRLTLGYKTPVAARDSLLFRTGETVHSHEFHRTDVVAVTEAHNVAATPSDGYAHVYAHAHIAPVDSTEPPPAPEPVVSTEPSAAPEDVSVRPTEAWHIGDRIEGLCTPTLHASYQHLHWAAIPQAAQRFAEAAAACARRHAPSTGSGSSPAQLDTTAEPPSDPHSTATNPLTHHGDLDVVPGLVDLAVNVRGPRPPDWLATILARPDRWAAYPDARPARAALAQRHGVDESMVLPTAGAAEAFTLVARAFRSRRAVVVHPQFTEPEQALRVAGIEPDRVVLRPDDGFVLHDGDVPDDADLVVVGNPTNPTGAMHPAALLRSLARPGRVLLVDEAFMDAVEGEPESLVRQEMPGVIVTRSLTKTWSLAGLRAGYVVGDPALVNALREQQTAWSVSTPALDAMIACSTPAALAEATADARLVARQRQVLVDELTAAGFPPVADSRAPFVLIDTARLGPESARESLQALGFAARRGETFPGLGPTHLRLAVRDEDTSRRLAQALRTLSGRGPR